MQTFLAGYTPPAVFAAMSLLGAAGAALSTLRIGGKLPDGATKQPLWGSWLDLLGVAGTGVLVQVWRPAPGSLRRCCAPHPAQGGVVVQAVCLTAGLQVAWAGPTVSLLTAALLVLVSHPSLPATTPEATPTSCAVLHAPRAADCPAGQDRGGQLNTGLAGAWPLVPAWSATLLFGFQPVAQVVSSPANARRRLASPWPVVACGGPVTLRPGLMPGRLQVQNLRNPSGLAGLSLASLLLATGGNGLMAPRALLLRDPIWLAGSAWGCFMGWTQLLTLYVGRTASGWGPRFPSPGQAVAHAHAGALTLGCTAGSDTLRWRPLGLPRCSWRHALHLFCGATLRAPRQQPELVQCLRMSSADCAPGVAPWMTWPHRIMRALTPVFAGQCQPAAAPSAR